MSAASLTGLINCMLRLGVNVDHVATMREVRGGVDSDPAFAALIAEASGADSIVAHLREDRRHIKEKDLYVLRQAIRTRLNLEMSVAPEIVRIACMLKPDQATLVPEKRQEITTEGGLDAARHFRKIKEAVERLEKEGIEVSLFIDPDKIQIDASKKLGVEMIELHTGRYAEAKNKKEEDKYFRQLVEASRYAKKKGLHVFAGHGLNYNNVSRVADIREIEELNIGYSIVCRAILVGFRNAVREMKLLMKR